jgi:hypothetical protein
MKKSVGAAITRFQTDANGNLVLRVSWLRARARAQRWNEEEKIVSKEMEWVVGTFEYMERIWEVRANGVGDEKLGHRAYAAKEADRWRRWAKVARIEFGKVCGVEKFQM